MSSKTYEIIGRNNRDISSGYNCKEYNINLNRNGNSNDKDKIIKELKSRIFELELGEKDYDILNERYKQLQCEFAALNDCKYHLECQKKKRDEDFNKRINELQCENEKLQNSTNEKFCKNKNIFTQNTALDSQIQLKDSEIYDLKAKINDLENQINNNEEERTNLKQIIKGLTNINNSQRTKICHLIEDNQTLNKICHEQDQDLELGNNQRNQMEKELDMRNNNIQDLNNKIKEGVNNINILQNEINKNNDINMKYQNNIKD
jgi:chromosome segregation ATPase